MSVVFNLWLKLLKSLTNLMAQLVERRRRAVVMQSVTGSRTGHLGTCFSTIHLVLYQYTLLVCLLVLRTGNNY